MISTHGAVMDSSFLFRIGSDMVGEQNALGIRIWQFEKRGLRR